MSNGRMIIEDSDSLRVSFRPKELLQSCARAKLRLNKRRERERELDVVNIADLRLVVREAINVNQVVYVESLIIESAVYHPIFGSRPERRYWEAAKSPEDSISPSDLVKTKAKGKLVQQLQDSTIDQIADAIGMYLPEYHGPLQSNQSQ